MKGLSFKVVEAIGNMIGTKFDALSLNFLGIIPKQIKEKNIIFTTSKHNIISLFLQALGNKDPNKLEEDTLKVMLRISSGYIDALKDRTTSRIIHDLDSYVRNQSLLDNPVSSNKIDTIINKEMDKAKSHFEMIVVGESTKAINIGTALQISKMADQKGIDDPVVFFVIVSDERTGFYEYILHTLPDRITPRLWLLSEIKSGYYKNGEQYPSFSDLHPNGRCKLTYLAPGWGFDKKGKIAYIDRDHDEFKDQRNKYGLPKVPPKPIKKDGQWYYGKK